MKTKTKNNMNDRITFVVTLYINVGNTKNFKNISSMNIKL